jgi:excisionase family DNA binding protein
MSIYVLLFPLKGLFFFEKRCIIVFGGDYMPDKLYTVAQAASYLQLSDKTIRRLISTKKLAASKVGDRVWRIKLSDIESYLKAHTNGKKGA